MTDQIFSVDNTLTLVHTTKTAARRTAPLRSYFVKAARVAVENVEKQQRAKLVRQPLIEEISNNSKRKSTDTTEPFTEVTPTNIFLLYFPKEKGVIYQLLYCISRLLRTCRTLPLKTDTGNMNEQRNNGD